MSIHSKFSFTSIAILLLCFAWGQESSDRCLSLENIPQQLQCLSDAIKGLSQENQSLHQSLAPIGAIVAWHKSFANTPPLPNGWVECNGQVLNDSNSPYNGQVLPNLNGERRFLRGGNESGKMEADEFKSHSHNLSIQGFAATGGLIAPHNGSGLGAIAWGNHLGVPAGMGTAGVQHQNIPGNRYIALDGEGAIWETGSSETRSINMSVVWIIKVK